MTLLLNPRRERLSVLVVMVTETWLGKPPLTRCVIRQGSLSEPQFPHLESGDNNSNKKILEPDG